MLSVTAVPVSWLVTTSRPGEVSSVRPFGRSIWAALPATTGSTWKPQPVSADGRLTPTPTPSTGYGVGLAATTLPGGSSRAARATRPRAVRRNLADTGIMGLLSC
jgi:hypothetical protein